MAMILSLPGMTPGRRIPGLMLLRHLLPNLPEKTIPQSRMPQRQVSRRPGQMRKGKAG